MVKLLLFAAISFIFLFSSCKKEVTNFKTAEINSTASSADNATFLSCNILPLTESWSTASSLSNWYQQGCADYSLQITDEHAKDGKYSLRSQVYFSDPLVKSGHRAEILRRPETGNERWYGFSIYAPSSFVPDPDREIDAQWHSSPDAGENTGPCVALKTDDGKWLVTISWDTDAITTKEQTKQFAIGNVALSKWTNWVFHIKFSYKADGFVEVWKNGVKVVNYNGPCWYNDAVLPYQKLGVYKGSWKSGTPHATSHRVLYYDKIAVADENGSYNDVAP